MTHSLRSVSRSKVALVAAGSTLLLGGDCDGDVLKDPTFRDWCANGLCSWTLDEGTIARVPTWNTNDLGVSFERTPTQISQVTLGDQPGCLLFTSVADIAPEAQVSLLVDFDNDGTIDVRQTLASTQWHKVQTEIPTPVVYSGVTFRLRKEGTGTAVLAELRVQSTDGCTGPGMLAPLLLGDPCTASTPCATGLLCSQPDPTQVGVCSQCDDHTPCANGAKCEPRGRLTQEQGFPNQCGPGLMLGAAGDPCFANDDCVSDTCKGGVLSDCFPASDATDAGTSCDSDGGASPGAGCECKTWHPGTCL